MSEQVIIFFLAGIVFLLILIVVYQRIMFHRGIPAELEKMAKKLSDVLDQDRDEKVMVFTDNKVLMDLSGQINRMLLDRQKIKVDYRRQELSSKKMLANIAHDIKTPLTVILGYLEIIRRSHTEDQELQKVEAKAVQVMEMINQFFTLAKLEAGDMDIEVTKININEVCRENILGFYELFSHHNFQVEIAIPEQDLFVLGEKKSIDRILSNLLSNVVRYGSDGNYLGLFLREQDKTVQIDIVDHGKGIQKESVPHVFDRLYTMEDSRNREIQGNGLGLMIAKNLAKQLGGDLTLDSQPHVQTVFTLTLKKSMDIAYH